MMQTEATGYHVSNKDMGPVKTGQYCTFYSFDIEFIEFHNHHVGERNAKLYTEKENTSRQLLREIIIMIIVYILEHGNTGIGIYHCYNT